MALGQWILGNQDNEQIDDDGVYLGWDELVFWCFVYYLGYLDKRLNLYTSTDDLRRKRGRERIL